MKSYDINTRCKVDDCKYKSRTFRRGLCASHYANFLETSRVVKNSDRLKPRPAIIEGNIAKIPLGVNAKHGYAIVDKEFAYLADHYKWCIDNYGYALTQTKSGRFKLHHMVVGKPTKGLVTDHVNRNKLDNRKSNLRQVSYSINNINRDISSDNKSGHKNVHYSKRDSKWYVQISRNYKVFNVGQFNTIENAVNARDKFLSNLKGIKV